MNDYEITFKRNGTIGYDIFTAKSKQEAIQSFKACYRHDTYIIISVDIFFINDHLS